MTAVQVAGAAIAFPWSRTGLTTCGSASFMAPNTVVGSAAFGTITAAGDPRVAQLALKVLF